MVRVFCVEPKMLRLIGRRIDVPQDAPAARLPDGPEDRPGDRVLEPDVLAHDQVLQCGVVELRRALSASSPQPSSRLWYDRQRLACTKSATSTRVPAPLAARSAEDESRVPWPESWSSAASEFRVRARNRTHRCVGSKSGSVQTVFNSVLPIEFVYVAASMSTVELIAGTLPVTMIRLAVTRPDDVVHVLEALSAARPTLDDLNAVEIPRSRDP